MPTRLQVQRHADSAKAPPQAAEAAASSPCSPWKRLTQLAEGQGSKAGAGAGDGAWAPKRPVVTFLEGVLQQGRDEEAGAGTGPPGAAAAARGLLRRGKPPKVVVEEGTGDGGEAAACDGGSKETIFQPGTGDSCERLFGFVTRTHLIHRRVSASDASPRSAAGQDVSPMPSPSAGQLRKDPLRRGSFPEKDRQEAIERVKRRSTGSETKMSVAAWAELDKSAKQTWTQVYQHLKGDGGPGLHRDMLPQALEFIGFSSVDEARIEQSIELLGHRFNTMDLGDFFNFIGAYEVFEFEMLEARLASPESGEIVGVSQLQAFLQGCGIIVSHACVLQVARELDVACGLPLKVEELNDVWRLVRYMSGFAKKEAAPLKGAFKKFDRLGQARVDVEELNNLLRWIGYALRAEEVSDLTSDMQGLKSILEPEFIALMRRLRSKETDSVEKFVEEHLDNDSVETFCLLKGRPWLRADPEGGSPTSAGVASAPAGMMRRELSFQDYRKESRRLSLSGVGRRSTKSQLFSPFHNRFTDEELYMLGELLVMLGYRPNRAAVNDAAEDATPRPGSSAASCTPLAAALKFVEIYRARDGFSRDEANEIEKTFRRYAGVQDGVGAVPKAKADKSLDEELVCTLEVGKMLRWFGYNPSYELQQQLVAQVDVDRCGCLDAVELRKMIRFYRLELVQKAIDIFEELDEEGNERLPESIAITGLEHLGIPVKDDEGEGLDHTIFNRGPMPAGTEAFGRLPSMPEDHEASSDEKGIDITTFVDTACELQEEMRENFRDNAGFSEKEVGGMWQTFKKYDEDNSGDICMSELSKILIELFPNLTSNMQVRRQLNKLMEEIETNGEGTLDFPDFLRVVRQFHELQEPTAASREQDVILQTQFTKREVEEFREIFELYAGGKKSSTRHAVMHFSQFLKMIHHILPQLSNKEVAHLVNLFADESPEKSVQDPTGRRSSNAKELCAGFPEFLLVMHKLLDENFAKIRERTTRIVQKKMAGGELMLQRRASRASSCLDRNQLLERVSKNSWNRRASFVSRKSVIGLEEMHAQLQRAAPLLSSEPLE